MAPLKTLFPKAVPWLFINSIIISVDTYSKGSPDLTDTWDSMLPRHGVVRPLNSSSPYEILVDRIIVKPGETVRVTIEAKNKNGAVFKGFLVIGKILSVFNEKLSRGVFILKHGNQNAKITNCFGNKESSITHTNSRDKAQVTFWWRAPVEEGEYVLVGTVLKSFRAFWINVKSSVITVTRSEFPGHHTNAAAKGIDADKKRPLFGFPHFILFTTAFIFLASYSIYSIIIKKTKGEDPKTRSPEPVRIQEKVGVQGNHNKECKLKQRKNKQD